MNDLGVIRLLVSKSELNHVPPKNGPVKFPSKSQRKEQEKKSSHKKQSRSAFHDLAEYFPRETALFELFLQYGADPNELDHRGKTVLQRVLKQLGKEEQKQFKFIRRLKQKQMEFEQQMDHLASLCGFLERERDHHRTGKKGSDNSSMLVEKSSKKSQSRGTSQSDQGDRKSKNLVVELSDSDDSDDSADDDTNDSDSDSNSDSDSDSNSNPELAEEEKQEIKEQVKKVIHFLFRTDDKQQSEISIPLSSNSTSTSTSVGSTLNLQESTFSGPSASVLPHPKEQEPSEEKTKH